MIFWTFLTTLRFLHYNIQFFGSLAYAESPQRTLWTMSVMVKYRVALWSFLQFTALVFYHVWHSPYRPLHTYFKIRRYWYLEYYLISLAKLLLYKGLNPLCDIEVSVNNRKSRKLTRHILIASVNMKPQYYFLF